MKHPPPEEAAGVFLSCSFPRDPFPEGPQPVVQAEKPGTFWLLVGSRHGPLPLQFEQVPPQLAGSMNTVPVPQVHRQPCWYPTTEGPASSDSPGAIHTRTPSSRRRHRRFPGPALTSEPSIKLSSEITSDFWFSHVVLTSDALVVVTCSHATTSTPPAATW